MTSHKCVLVTDYTWPNIDIERAILSGVDAEVLVAQTGEEDELIALAPQVDAILSNLRKLRRPTIEAATKCQIIVRYGVGLDNIDIAAATECGIAVANVPDYCTDEVSDEVMALLLCGARGIIPYDRSVHSGTWDIKVGKPLFRIKGRTLGIIGFGLIGQAIVPKAQAFGLRVVACDPYVDSNEMLQRGVMPMDLDTLLREADFVTLHVPLAPETRGLINHTNLWKMKPTAWLINTSRGPVVDTTALYDALCQKRLAGAGLDVLPQEPPDFNDPLFTLPNVIVTPHTAYYSEGSLHELQAKAAERVAEALSGRLPGSLVNPAILSQSNRRLIACRSEQ